MNNNKKNNEKHFMDMTQDELYNLLIECGAKNIRKVESGKGGVIFIDDDDTSHIGSVPVLESFYADPSTNIIYKNSDDTDNMPQYSIEDSD
jgi:hypothetical protein